MSEDNIDPIGIPRTDIFFNDDMKKEKAITEYIVNILSLRVRI